MSLAVRCVAGWAEDTDVAARRVKPLQNTDALYLEAQPVYTTRLPNTPI